MLEIAKSEDQEGVFQKDIARVQEISYKYLDHIISALKTAGLITNVKGKKSGYKLTREPSSISIYDIHNAFEPGICIVECISDAVNCESEDTCATKKLWSGLNSQIIEYLKNYTLEDLLIEQNNIDTQTEKSKNKQPQ
jgi:Rrf2 family protein